MLRKFPSSQRRGIQLITTSDQPHRNRNHVKKQPQINKEKVNPSAKINNQIVIKSSCLKSIGIEDQSVEKVKVQQKPASKPKKDLTIEEEKQDQMQSKAAANASTNVTKLQETPASASIFNTPNNKDAADRFQVTALHSDGNNANHHFGIQVGPLSQQNSAPLISQHESLNGLSKEKYETIIKRAPKLVLKLLEGTAFPKDQSIRISPLGVENIESQRLQVIRRMKQHEEEKVPGDIFKGDFITYFGAYNISDLQKGQNIDESKLNDVILPKAEGFGQRHFAIQFNVEKNWYCLKDLGEGTGTFMRVDRQFILKNGHIVSFGDSHMVVGLVLEKREKPEEVDQQKPAMNLSTKPAGQDKSLVTQLMVQFIDGPKSKETYTFKQEQVPILIGRSHECNISFKEGNLSRVQCRIDYIDEKWILKDGNGSKPSTNGTWLFAGEDEKLQEGMIFKAGHSLFQVNLVHD